MQQTLEKRCPACLQTTQHNIILSRAPVPTLQNTTIKSSEEARAFPSASLSIAICQRCSFVWNDAFADDLICYDKSYNNDVSKSAFYRRHLEARADAVIASVPVGKPIHYVEIGCGEADFLRLVVERANGRVASAVGFDPSFSSDVSLPPNTVVHREFFTPDSNDKILDNVNVICSRHTIEHIADPRQFAETLAGIMQREDQTLFVETPTVDWIFENNAFFDFFFEHCSLFNPHSIAGMFGSFGLTGSVGTVYGDQYLWAELKCGHRVEINRRAVAQTIALADSYHSTSHDLISHWTERLSNRAPGARIGVWGAASKGVTFALIMQQAGQRIDFAIDLNKDKQGCFTPLTALLISAPENVGLTDADTVIVMNPNYADEIKRDIKKMGVQPDIVVL